MAWNTKSCEIINIEHDFSKEYVYDIEMPKHHNFFCNDNLVHNCHHVDPIDLIMTIRKQKPIEEASQYTKIIIHFLKLNPKMRIVGYTGSPYRGSVDIIGAFWSEIIYDVSTMYLIGLGYLVPVTFGFGDDSHKYDLSEWDPVQDQNGTGDYSSKELAAMQRKITKEDQLTKVIIE